jgi:hypothetical protein
MSEDLLLAGQNDGAGAVEAQVEVLLGMWLCCI